MAIHFIHRGGYDMGQHMYTASKEEIMVGIRHDPRNGYRLAHGGDVIKEQLGLREFIERLVRVENFNTASHNSLETVVERDMYRIIEAITSRNSATIEHVAEWLDQRYASLILDKKLTLMQHNHSVNVGQVSHRETVSNKQRSTTQWDAEKVMKHMDEQGIYPQQSGVMKQMTQEDMKRQYPMTPDEAFRVSDDEVYYYIS